MKEKSLFNWKIMLAMAWFLLTLSLIIWWMILGMRSIDTQKHTMILTEGMTLIVSFVLGGSLLIRYLLLERARILKLQEFFAVFNHEVKTYITSLRLKVEGLSMDLEKTGNDTEAKKIIDDTVRLELQLENSLFLANPKTSKMFNQNLNIKELVTSLEANWSDVQIEYINNVSIYADKRAAQTIFKNIIQNAKVHGKARKIKLISTENETRVEIKIENDGDAFTGQLNRLGHLFYRHGRTSRSGVGVYLIYKLLKIMNGTLRFEIDDNNKLVYILTFEKGSL